MSKPSTSADLELDRERFFGGIGVEVDRTITCIDLSNFDQRRDEIDTELWTAATRDGFFQVTNHGISQDAIDEAFELSAAFFAQPIEQKQAVAMPAGTNSGWEHRSQKRPSTGTLDEKESFQVTRSRMDQLGLWPMSPDEIRTTLLSFEKANWELAMRLLGCFARRLGFEDGFFTERHDPQSPHHQSTLRLLHYLPMNVADLDPSIWRAGAHTDYDCLTLLHQVEGQRGLQVSPGRDAIAGSDGAPLEWTPLEPLAGTITCNIGDMLMRWSDDQLPSTLHRVRMPKPDEDLGPRYSIAYFAQADTDAVIHGPSKRLGPITAGDFLQQRIAANFTK